MTLMYSVKLILRKIVGASGWLSWLSVQLLVSAQVMIIKFMRLSPALGSVLAARSLLGILSLPLSVSLCPSAARVLSLSLKIDK